MTFGTLYVLGEDVERNMSEKARRKNGEIVHTKLYWRCRCASCGSIASYSGDNLKSGNSTTCYSCRNNKISNALKKKNNIIIRDNVAEIEASNTHNKFIFDECDVNILEKYCWHETSYGYLASRIPGYGITFAHRLLMLGLDGIDDDVVIDHINGDRKDCRRANMRICTAQQNGWNRHVVRSKSGFIGVYPVRGSNGWRASIRANGEIIDLGRFDNIDDAKNARIRAEQKYYGEYAPKHMPSQA